MSRLTSRQALVLAGALVLTAAVTWATWPGAIFVVRERGPIRSLVTAALPSAIIRIEPGGRAMFRTNRDDVALPDTIRITTGMPARLRFDNRDSVMHRLGPFAIRARTERSYTIPTAGVYAGFCTAHPARRITYVVE
jgi:hypothetical protein